MYMYALFSPTKSYLHTQKFIPSGGIAELFIDSDNSVQMVQSDKKAMLLFTVIVSMCGALR